VLDDILVWGKDQQQHDDRLHTVLNKLQAAGVTLNMEKCELEKREIKFLGHILSGLLISWKEGEQWRPVVYASRSMTETEQRYAQVEKKVLGLTWG
ncbi:hypothetical protein QTP86_028199, partial [Hemibagrus guttatus]